MADYYRSDPMDDPRARPRRYRDRPVEYKETIHVESRAAGRAPRQMDLVRRSQEEDETSIEEIQRDFPPGQQYGRRDLAQQRRGQSLERDRGYGYDYDVAAYAARSGGDSRRSAGDVAESRSVRRARHEDRRERRGRSLSRNQEIAAAAAGAGLAVGGKELWDRRDGGKHRPRSRSRLGQVALGVAGAAAGDLAAKQYAKTRERRHEKEEDYEQRPRYAAGGYADGYDAGSDYDDRPKRHDSRRKSFGEAAGAALGALGLGAAVKGGDRRDDRRDDRGDDRPRRRRRRHRGSSSSETYSQGSSPSRNRSRSRGTGRDTNQRLQQAAKAALTAAAVEAWRSRKEPGGYLQGEKARRILTAAAGAGGIDALVDKNPDRHEGRHVGEGALGGLLLNRLVNGSREEDFSRNGRRSGRSRSRSRGGTLKDLGAAGLAAVAAKKFTDSRDGSKSRSRRDRRYSSSSSGSRTPPTSRRRSKSVSEYVDKGMAKLGLGDKKDRRDDRGSERQISRRSDDGYSQARSMPRDGGDRRSGGRARAAKGKGGSSSSSNSSDSDFSLSAEEKDHKKLKGKEYLTAGLATVATVHAAHEIYESMEKRKQRRKAVRDGKMEPAEAKRLKSKSHLQDAFAVGLAGLAIKGTVGAWKEMREQRHEVHSMETKLEKHRRIVQERQKGLGRNQSFRNSAPDLAGGSPNYGNEPMYQDGNPYASARQQTWGPNGY